MQLRHYNDAAVRQASDRNLDVAGDEVLSHFAESARRGLLAPRLGVELADTLVGFRDADLREASERLGVQPANGRSIPI